MSSPRLSPVEVAHWLRTASADELAKVRATLPGGGLDMGEKWETRAAREGGAFSMVATVETHQTVTLSFLQSTILEQRLPLLPREAFWPGTTP